MGIFLVERYWEGVTEQQAADAAVRARVTAQEMAGEGVAIRFVSSSLVPADEAILTFFEASSAEVVAEANRRAGLPVDRISACVTVPT